MQKIRNKWISRTKGVSIVWHIKRSQDHGVTTWHAKSLPDFDSEFVNTNLIIRLCAYKTCLHAIIKVEMAFFSTFFFAVTEKIVYRIVEHKRKKDDTQHLLSSLHAIKNMRNYMWIMNKTLPDPLLYLQTGLPFPSQCWDIDYIVWENLMRIWFFLMNGQRLFCISELVHASWSPPLYQEMNWINRFQWFKNLNVIRFS